MCLKIKSGPHYAKKDISVFKIVLNDNRSFYRKFTYTPNTQYRQVGIRPYFGGIKRGYHAYRRELSDVYFQGYAGGYMINFRDSYSITIDLGTEKIVAFTIPKGAKYYIGFRGDIVATEIKSGSLKAMRPRDLRRHIKGKV